MGVPEQQSFPAMAADVSAGVSHDPAAGGVSPRAVQTTADALGRLRRGLLIGAGVVSVGLGLVGVVVPVLPTTPFLLLAAACFLRSSDHMYRWLVGNRLFGHYIRRYREGAGVPLASKVVTLALLWATLAASAFFAIPSRLWWIRLVLAAVGVGVTIHVARIRTARPSH